MMHFQSRFLLIFSVLFFIIHTTLYIVFTLISAGGAYYIQDFLDPALIRGRRVLEARRLLNSAQLINLKKLKKMAGCKMVGCKHRWHCTIYSAIEYTRYIRRLEEVSTFITDLLLIRDPALIRGPALNGVNTVCIFNKEFQEFLYI